MVRLHTVQANFSREEETEVFKLDDILEASYHRIRILFDNFDDRKVVICINRHSNRELWHIIFE